MIDFLEGCTMRNLLRSSNMPLAFKHEYNALDWWAPESILPELAHAANIDLITSWRNKIHVACFQYVAFQALHTKLGQLLYFDTNPCLNHLQKMGMNSNLNCYLDKNVWPIYWIYKCLKTWTQFSTFNSEKCQTHLLNWQMSEKFDLSIEYGQTRPLSLTVKWERDTDHTLFSHQSTNLCWPSCHIMISPHRQSSQFAVFPSFVSHWTTNQPIHFGHMCHKFLLETLSFLSSSRVYTWSVSLCY